MMCNRGRRSNDVLGFVVMFSVDPASVQKRTSGVVMAVHYWKKGNLGACMGLRFVSEYEAWPVRTAEVTGMRV